MSRGASARLARALVQAAAAAGATAEVVSSTTRDWASATFVGARHRLVLAVLPSVSLDGWLAGLPTADVQLPGHLLAELVVAPEQASDARHVTIDALTLQQ